MAGDGVIEGGETHVPWPEFVSVNKFPSLSTHRLLKQLSFRAHFFPLHTVLLAVAEQYPLARTIFTVPSAFSGQENDESQQVGGHVVES